MARSRQATENVRRALERDHGLLTEAEADALLGDQPRAGLVGVLRDGELRYPGFQCAGAGILSVMAPLLELARANGWDDSNVALWLFSPITSFGGSDRPMDHLDDAKALLAVAKDSFEAEW
ncbi:hypothetical protein E3T61_03195 [Cryobacterium lactosi]|uniref:DUF2384 domain-containing protein n=1 Tax=Cryobacterium lactosi TaxID=1259202 RepID=A0A4R9BZN1_9MICO|nr:hypothetical protein [Cryobacterium lactosi]TFD94018.1 hypothetical protein E3T61_03195 [Cryobacterium lactosi]